MNHPIKELSKIPVGSLVRHNKKLFFLCNGLDGKIVQDTDAHWHFVRDLEWKTFEIVFLNEKT